MLYRQWRALASTSIGVRPCAWSESPVLGRPLRRAPLVHLVAPTSGTVVVNQANVAKLRGRSLREFRRNVQCVFQDPFESLNPRQQIGDIVSEPLLVNKVGGTKQELRERVLESLEEAGLSPAEDYVHRRPQALSGGQRQRVCIAAATIVQPELLIADEPVSMLDVSVRAGIVRLLASLRARRNMTLLFITHDLSLAWAIGDRIGVMYGGRLVELGSAHDVIRRPAHPYTTALTASIPEADPDVPLHPMRLLGDSSTLAAPSGCPFRLRCPYSVARCAEAVPELSEADGPGHLTACIRYRELCNELLEGGRGRQDEENKQSSFT